MKEFFKGWQRKVGTVTLVLACAFELGWIRSESTTDVVAFFARGTTVNLYSQNGILRLIATQDVSAPASAFVTCGSIPSMESFPPNHRQITEIVCFPDSNRNALFGSLQIGFHKPSCIVEIEISYWPITTFLILVSAWLLVSKPRTKIEAPITPASENP